MAVEFKYPWRFFDRSGNVVADGYSQFEEDAGDFYLNKDGVFENKETGQLRNGDIVDYDENGNRLTNGKYSDKSRAFGEIRSSLGTGVSPAFEKAVHSDKPKIENPNEPTPDTPTPPNGGVGSGGLIGQIAKQNEILNKLVSKVGENRELKKVSRALGSLEKGIKNSVDKISSSIKEKNDGSKIFAAIGSLNQNLGKISENVAAVKDNGKGMLDIEKDRHKFETTAKSVKDLDGQVVANISPRDAQVVKNASQARIATDTNNFELSANDLDDLFGDLPDISSLFDIPYSSSVGVEYTK